MSDLKLVIVFLELGEMLFDCVPVFGAFSFPTDCDLLVLAAVIFPERFTCVHKCAVAFELD